MENIRQEDFERIFKQHLKIETYSKTIDSLLGPRSLNKINYHPYYQRNYVWDNNKATYFIESILLGTEIPPLIFFNNNTNIEVIDGRQRFETILRFKDNKFALTKKGLDSLTQLEKLTYDDLAKKDISIIEAFLDAKIRIIEFALVNEPPLDKYLEDRVKKEIFSRYNTGITPLKKSEIDNAIYDDDPISTEFKTTLKNTDLLKLIYNTFFTTKEKSIDNPPLDKILEFIRKFLVLPRFPIKYYARTNTRVDIHSKLYDLLSNSVSNSLEDIEPLIKDFISKTSFVATTKDISEENNFSSNRLAYECLLWALYIVEQEGVEIDYEDNDLKYDYAKYVHDNISNYNDIDFHYFKEIIARFSSTVDFFESKYNINLGVYINGSPEKRVEIKELDKHLTDTKKQLGQLEYLRLNKPEPTKNSIEDIIRVMQRRRFLVRPSYQRKEVINPTKASSIIESILLGITLPALFIYKRQDNISEVIDGQQRILTILGFVGTEYIDENERTSVSKNHKFTLRKPRILKEIEGLRFDKLSADQQSKILDFQLYIVEIEEAKNPEFNPVDLFIRLNDKPYPIRENSFEMWNSWADFEVMNKLKEISRKHKHWFYLKQLRSPKDRDRMENEELITSLAFLDFFSDGNEKRKILDVYQKRERINARISDKTFVSQLLQEVTDSEVTKNDFCNSIKFTENFIKKLKIVLLDKDKKEEELFDYLKNELDIILKGGKDTLRFRRTMQDFYILHQFLNDINLEMIKFNRLNIKKELSDAFKYIKNIPEEEIGDNKGFEKYKHILIEFKDKYKKDERKLRLNEDQKLKMIKDQNNQSGISSAPIFLGDEIEADHTTPLSVGGKDEIENITIVHKDENRSKGSRV